MIDSNIEILRQLIKDKREFRIGRRGICIDFRFNGFRWLGYIPRGDITLSFSLLRVTEPGDTLSCECPGFNPMRVDLTQYDKLTMKEWRVN